MAARQRAQETGVDAGRRDFFRRFLGHSPDAAKGHRVLPAERLALVKDIAARWRGALPQGAIPRLEASDACAHHGVCVAVCPTGAVRPYSGAAQAGLEFEPGACIACGVCVAVCPEKALALKADRTETRSATAVRITRHAMRACVRCDDEFAAHGEDDLCPACRKDIGLFLTGFSARSET
jgi:ferredoxin